MTDFHPVSLSALEYEHLIARQRELEDIVRRYLHCDNSNGYNTSLTEAARAILSAGDKK